MNDEMFEKRKGAVFGERGITREVAECGGAFYAYRQGERIPTEWVWVGDPFEGYLGIGVPERPEREALTYKELAAIEEMTNERAKRASGLMMRRFPVPEADPFLFAQQRPDWAIWSGGFPKGSSHGRFGWGARAKHEDTLKNWKKKHPVTSEQVERSMTPSELARFRKRDGWEVNRGGDHFGKRTNRFHVHVEPGKYLFVPNRRERVPFEHRHADLVKSRLQSHLYEEHGFPSYAYAENAPDVRGRDLVGDHGRVITSAEKHVRGEVVSFADGQHVRTVTYGDKPPLDALHGHKAERDRHFYARRLSSHPMGFARIRDANVVCFAFEGELKEAALVSAGHATFSCPAVWLWDAPELSAFVQQHLLGKLVLIIPDSDALENDQVVMPTLLAKERLDWLGADAEIAIPTPEPADCELHGAKAGDKRGVDDYLADGGTLEEMTWFVREPGKDLKTWLKENDAQDRAGKKPRGILQDGGRVDQDNVVLRWLALHADKDGRSRAALQSIAGYVRPELEELREKPFANLAHATTDVSKAVKRMDKEHGVLDGSDSLSDRRWDHESDEWPGELQIVPVELRADDSGGGTVAELLARRDAE